MKTIAVEDLWTGQFIRTLAITYEGRDGAIHTWEAFQRPNIGGIVVLVPVKADGTLILIRQFRPPVGQAVIELPAGLVDIGETPLECAARELVEETGYRAGRIEHLISGPTVPAISRESIDVYLALKLEFAGKNGGDANEDIETIEIPFDSAVDFLIGESAAGRLVDLKVFGLLEIARRKLAEKS